MVSKSALCAVFEQPTTKIAAAIAVSDEARSRHETEVSFNVGTRWNIRVVRNLNAEIENCIPFLQ